MTELWRFAAHELLAGLRRRRFSARDVTQACLARLEATNPVLNAITETRPEAALAAADAADRAWTRGEWLGPLHGIPVTIKGNADLEGWATTNSCRTLANNVAPSSAPAIARLVAAGAIVLGRTNTPEFCCRWDTDNELYGRTWNPWDRGRTAGGSSGGAAASLAAGVTPIAHGNDLGGSLRQPAQACGVASLRPTNGQVPMWNATEHGEVGIGVQLMATEGPMARTVADVELAFDVMRGVDRRDPWSVPAAGVRFGACRVALVVDPVAGGVDPQVARGVERAGRLLRQAGYVVDEVEPPGIDAAVRIWRTVCIGELLTQLEPAVRDRIGPALTRTLANYRAITAPLTLADYAAALADRRRVRREWLAFGERYPLIVAPVGTELPFAPDADNASPEATARVIASFRMTVAVNALGLPAAVVPVGLDEGLPQVVQVIGMPFADHACLAAAAAIEAQVEPLTPIDPRG